MSAAEPSSAFIVRRAGCGKMKSFNLEAHGSIQGGGFIHCPSKFCEDVSLFANAPAIEMRRIPAFLHISLSTMGGGLWTHCSVASAIIVGYSLPARKDAIPFKPAWKSGCNRCRNRRRHRGHSSVWTALRDQPGRKACHGLASRRDYTHRNKGGACARDSDFILRTKPQSSC